MFQRRAVGIGSPAFATFARHRLACRPSLMSFVRKQCNLQSSVDTPANDSNVLTTPLLMTAEYEDPAQCRQRRRLKGRYFNLVIVMPRTNEISDTWTAHSNFECSSTFSRCDIHLDEADASIATITIR